MLKNRRRFLYLILLAIITAKSKAQVTVGEGVSLVADSGTFVNVNDLSFSNHGSISSAPGTLVFSGSLPAENMYLESVLPLSGITLQKSGGGLSLQSDVFLTNIIRLDGGILELNRNDLNLGSEGVIEGENNATYITGKSGGYVIRQANLNAPQGVDAGNLGLQITTTADMGETLIRRSHVQPTSPTGYGIYRYFNIIPQNNENLNATVKFTFLNGELAGINKEELKMWSSFDKGVTWSLLGADAVDTDNNGVTKSGISSFSYLTLGSDQNHALPLQLLSLTVVPNAAGGADVKWTTTQEINMSVYEVEKSDDGTTFTRFATLAARGGNSTTQSYVAADKVPLYGTRYYRLKEVAKDGTINYSTIISLTGAAFRNQLLALYPNPAVGPIHVRFTSVKEQPVVLQIMNATGQLVALKRTTVLKGVNEIVFDASPLAAGMYYLRLDNISNQTIPFFKSGK